MFLGDFGCFLKEWNTLSFNWVCRAYSDEALFTEKLKTIPGVPIAYPRMVFLETALESKFNPLLVLGRAGSMGLGGFVNKFNAEAELLDDLVSWSRLDII